MRQDGRCTFACCRRNRVDASKYLQHSFPVVSRYRITKVCSYPGTYACLQHPEDFMHLKAARDFCLKRLVHFAQMISAPAAWLSLKRNSEITQ